VNADDKRRLADYFDFGFQLQVDDLVRSSEADVRMGTFIQAAAFMDALALAYSAPGLPKKVKGGDAGKWRRFVDDYFDPVYAPVAAGYDGFRCLLLHNFSASHLLGFTHDEPHRHLQDEGGRLILDRGSFVAAIATAYEAFKRDVLANETQGARVLAWLDRYPPVGFWAPPVRTVPSTAASAASTTAVSFALSATSATGTGPGPLHSLLQRAPDRPHSPRMATSIKQKPRKPK
jgi:hypothetical protein